MCRSLFLSVVTPTYNRANKLQRVFNSIQRQTLKKVDGNYIFEWIIIDDGSVDNTRVLIEKWKNEVDWPIIYKYQENKGKHWAVAEGVKLARGELTLIADSDDEFLPETFETFYNVWNGFTEEERKKCGGIGVLCEDQYGKRIGCDFPIEKKLIPAEIPVVKWKHIGLGETWAIIKTKNLKYAFLNIPEEAKNLKFIPESFFWDKITFDLKQYSYTINKVLRIYYKENDNISHNIRRKYPEGFYFTSKYFITHYPKVLFKYPKIYLKHLLKFFYFKTKGF